MLDPSFNPGVFFNEPAPRIHKRTVGAIIAGVLCLAMLFYVSFFGPPADFPENTALSIPSGWGLSQTATYLKEHHVIRSKFVFKATAVVFGSSKNIVAGNYLFESDVPVWNVVWRLGHGVHGFTIARVTIPEGSTLQDIATIFSRKFPFFESNEFADLSRGKEGYLFPDTYLFGTDADAARVIAVLSDNFLTRTADAKKAAAAKKKKFSDVITMASIIEEEANDEKSRRIVSGILWKRIQLGMPLQVDATLKYITGRGTSELTTADLAIKSPYNSYTNLGLPPAPIANPGLAAIDAALNPTATSYLYFLTDNKGNMHYAATFEEHTANKQKYLP